MSAECRYAPAGCRKPVTHVCGECNPGYFCTEHAARHDLMVLEEFTRPGAPDRKYAILAQPITDKGAL